MDSSYSQIGVTTSHIEFGNVGNLGDVRRLFEELVPRRTMATRRPLHEFDGEPLTFLGRTAMRPIDVGVTNPERLEARRHDTCSASSSARRSPNAASRSAFSAGKVAAQKPTFRSI